MAGLVERGLVAFPSEPQPGFGACAYFTAAGLAALRELLQDRRSMAPEVSRTCARNSVDPAFAEVGE